MTGDIHPGDAYTLAAKVIEMFERVQKVDKVVPGAFAKTVIEADGVPFELTARVHRAEYDKEPE